MKRSTSFIAHTEVYKVYQTPLAPIGGYTKIQQEQQGLLRAKRDAQKDSAKIASKTRRSEKLRADHEDFTSETRLAEKLCKYCDQDETLRKTSSRPRRLYDQNETRRKTPERLRADHEDFRNAIKRLR